MKSVRTYLLLLLTLLAGAVSSEPGAQSARTPRSATSPTVPGQVANAQNGHAINVSGIGNVVKIGGDLDEKTRAQLDAAIRGEQKTQRLLAEVRVEYKKAIATIQALANQINAGPREKEAAQALAAGNSAPSEALLQDQEKGTLKSAEKDAVDAEKHRKEAAELARQRGALAFLTDKSAALNAYLTAATYDPADVKTQIFIGDLQNLLGDTNAAKDTFVNAASVAEANLRKYPDQVDAARELAISTDRIGESLEKQGDLQGAVARYQQALALLDSLAKRAPDDMPLQIDLAESHAILGSALRNQGDSNAALAQYEAAIAITTPLLKRYPDDAAVQLATAANHLRAGRILESSGNLSAALNEYRQARAIAESQTTQQRTEAAKVSDVSVGHHNADLIVLAANGAFGQILMTQGDLAGAIGAFEQGLKVSEQLTQRDTGNEDWQLTAALYHFQIGGVRMLQGDTDSTLAEFSKAGTLYSAMAQKDPTNLDLQGSAAAMHFLSAGPLLMAGDSGAAAAEARLAVAGLENAVQRVPDETAWHTILGQAYIVEAEANMVKAASRKPDDTPYDGKQQLEKAASIFEKLLARDPANANTRSCLGATRMIQALLLQTEDPARAASAASEAVAIYEQLVKDDPTNMLDMSNLGQSLLELSKAKQSLGDRAAARAALTRAIDTIHDVLKANPDNAMMQALLAMGYLDLARTADSPEDRRSYLQQGSAILTGLKERGHLPEAFAILIPVFDRELAALGVQ